MLVDVFTGKEIERMPYKIAVRHATSSTVR